MVAAAVGIGTAVAGIAGSAMSSSAASSAANDQTQAQLAAIAEQQRQYDLSRSDEMPYMQAGQQNLALLEKLNSGDYSSFHESPDYLFTQQQGIQGLDRSAASAGSLYSGGHSADLLAYNQGLAEKNYNDYYNKIAGIANLGQDATAHTGVLGAGAADAISNSLGNIGNAQAQGLIGSANAWSQGLNGLGSAFGHVASGWGGGGSPQFPGAYSAAMGFGQGSGYSFGGNFTGGYG